MVLLPFKMKDTQRSVPEPLVEAGFPPDSTISRVGAEALVLLGGGRAVLLQLAHPLIAAGVSDYSEFQRDPLARLLRTMTFVHALVFGDSDQVNQALTSFDRVHSRIRGRVTGAAGSWPEDTPYHGQDPDLKLWVYATLVDTSLVSYQQFVAPISSEQERAYYQDALTIARWMGIPREILPLTWTDFQDYMRGMLESDRIAVTDTSRLLAHQVLHPEVGFIPSMSSALLRLTTGGLLTPSLREEFGLAWSPVQAALFHIVSGMTRALRPIVPPWVWQSPLHGDGLARKLIYWGLDVELELDNQHP